MTDKQAENDRLPVDQEGEGEEMFVAHCQSCVEHNAAWEAARGYDRERLGPWREPRISIHCFRVGRDESRQNETLLEGIVTCLHDGHRRPVKIVNNLIDETAPKLPVDESKNLTASVDKDLVQDIEEAERTYFALAYKASVVMCRRAIQLAIERKPGAPQKVTLGPLLDWLRIQKPALVNNRVMSLADGIKDYGDGGAHRPETFSPSEVAMVIHNTVTVLNGLMP